MVLWAASEMGDEAIIAATRKTMDERYGAGIADSMSWAGRNTVRNMVNKGLPEAWAKGPLLDQATYPDTIVTRAVSDGSALSLVLRPGGEAVRTPLGFGRLVPDRRYRVRQTGGELVADRDGKATLDVMLADRVELDLVPLA